MEDQGRHCLHSCVCFHSTYLIWHRRSILGETKWRRTPEIQIFLWSIFQFAWPFNRVNSFASAATRRLCLPTPTSVTYPWWKNRPPQLHAGNSRCHVSGAKPGPSDNRQPLNCHSSETARLNRRVGLAWQTSARMFWQPKPDSLLRGALTRFPQSHVLYMHTHAQSLTHAHRLPTRRGHQKKRGDKKKKKKKQLQTHQALCGL